MRFFNHQILPAGAIVALLFSACSRVSDAPAQQSAQATGVRSEVVQEPHEDPPTKLFAIPNPGAVEDPWAFTRAIHERNTSFKVIDEDGKTFAEIKSSTEGSSFPITQLDGRSMLEGTSLSGEPLFIDMVNKKMFASPKVRYLSHFSDGLAVFRSGSDSPCGWADEQGEIQIPAKFNKCSHFRDGIAIVSKTIGTGMLKKSLTGLIDKSGSELVPFAEVDRIEFIGNNRYAIVQGASMGGRDGGAIYDAPKRRLIPVPGLKFVDFNSQAALLLVETNSVMSYYYLAPGADPVEFKDKTKLSTRLLGKNITTMDQRVAMTLQPTAFTVWTPDGRQIAQEQIIFRVGEAKGYRDVVSGGREADRFGVLREDGKWAIAPEETGFKDFRYGWASALNSGKWRMVDTTGKTLFSLPGEPQGYVSGAVITIAPTYDGKGGIDYAVWNRAGKRIYGITVKGR
jgi:hypothetical protein